ncbi:MAG: methyltransferase domain-containing protein [Austwickia sp.]|jgi:S-adenosylmethionine-dependent methyltransferase|nr:methyltransferase domain-containing protein [Austwickia sp.]MBK8435570.1 methyltransferase domain-containing protein [Austwickia sp.]MBK9100859.1 methyltransferase domain-containing protein [Austwickia sp.]
MPDEQRRARRGSPETALRTAAVWESVLALVAERQEALGRPLQVLDIGGGTGGLSVPLAERGHQVTVVDPSPDALAALDRRIAEAGVADRVLAIQGDATTVSQVCPQLRADVVCCHGVLEVVDDPQGAVTSLANALAPQGLLSIVVAQRLAAVVARALAGRFAQARQALSSPDGRWGEADPLPRRFDVAAVEAMLTAAGLVVVERTGVRVFSDLVPSGFVDTEADRVALLALEREVAMHPDFAFLGQIGASAHVVARRD